MTGRPSKQPERGVGSPPVRPAYPFTAIVGQEEMKLALLLNVIAPSVGGVLIMGHRGTGKSTAVRALAQLLPHITTVRGCPYNCDPKDTDAVCRGCRRRLEAGGKLARQQKPVPVVDLPLGATEDRVCGTIDIERALRDGAKSFEPGLLARANRGFLYIDEVNLLEDHLVDLLLDAAATGSNKVEREGVSEEHPARFVLVGSGNPEEGELRPQFQDRFGTCVEVETILDTEARVRIVEQREAFERDPESFVKSSESELEDLRRRLLRAKRNHARAEIPHEVLRSVAALCVRLKVDGHRGEITIARAARALAAFEGRKKVAAEDVRRVAPMCLRHRLRRDPLERVESGARIEEAIGEILGGESGEEVKRSAGRDDVVKPSTPGAFTGGNGGAARKPSRGDERHEPENSRSNQTASEDARVIPSANATLPEVILDSSGANLNQNGKINQPARGGVGQRRTSYSRRGRYSSTTGEKSRGRGVAADATIRRAAHSQAGRRKSDVSKLLIAPEDLRYKRLRGKAGTLYIFAVDTSGSMALNRIQHAKGAALHLLRKAYVNRDRVALICFRARAAEVALPPCTSAARAGRILESLPVGGATPLGSALRCALELARRAHTPWSGRTVLVLFTDGRGNVPLKDCRTADRGVIRKQVESEVRRLGVELQGEGVASLVVDTARPLVSCGEGRFVAEALGGRYVQLPQVPQWQDSIKLIEA